MAGLQSLLQPINDAVMSVMEIKDSNRGNELSNHLSAVADGIMVLGWVAVENRPSKHVDEFLGSAQFFGNKVLKEYKEKYGLLYGVLDFLVTRFADLYVLQRPEACRVDPVLLHHLPGPV